MNNILEKIKKTLPIVEKILPIIEKYQRYIYVCGLFLVMTVILYLWTGEEVIEKRLRELNSKTVSGEDYVPDKEFEVDAYAELNELISLYFDAYVNADFETLETIATPISDMEKSYITTMCQFYDEYQNIKCYTKHGLSKDSFVVSVCFDIKFMDHDAVAPSMQTFYVQTNKDGELYINNLYSDFNMRYDELDIDKDVYMALEKYVSQNDYISLLYDVETEYNNWLKENGELRILITQTIPAVRQQWEQDVLIAEEEEDTEGTEEPGTEEPSTEEPGTDEPTTELPSTENPTTENPSTEEPTPTPEPEPEPVVEKVKVLKNNVNVRSAADADSDKLGQANQGDVFVKLGVDGDWTKIQYDDKSGYIKTSYLEAVTE